MKTNALHLNTIFKFHYDWLIFTEVKDEGKYGKALEIKEVKKGIRIRHTNISFLDLNDIKTEPFANGDFSTRKIV